MTPGIREAMRVSRANVNDIQSSHINCLESRLYFVPVKWRMFSVGKMHCGQKLRAAKSKLKYEY